MRRVECDVLVVGSGCAGLATAVASAHRGLKVIVAEKEPVFGGTTARSGGWMWVPNSGPARRAGVEDSVEQARTYLKHETGAFYDAERIDAFLDAAPQAVEFFEANTTLQFDVGREFSDYHPDAPGGTSGGRAVVARPFDGRELGGEIARLRPPLREITFLGMMIGSGKELQHFFNVTRSPVSLFYVARLMARFVRDMAFYGRPMRLVNGNALIGRLAKSCFDKGVPIWTSSPATSLITGKGGRIVGAVLDTPTGRCEVHAARGVVMAAGGFPQDPILRRQLLPHAPSGYEHASPAPPGNTGDGLRLGETAGAEIEKRYPNAAALVPISRPVRPDGTPGTFPHFVDRYKPGIIAITRSGRRFVNEANSYHDFCRAMIQRCAEEGTENAAWLIADHRTYRKYGLGFAKPAPVPYERLIKSGYLLRGRTLIDLAREIGADGAQLERTVASYNEHARKGEDPEFGKGSTAYNRCLGDQEVKPNPCLAPVENGPFYAVRLHIGDLGTFAGLKTNRNGEALTTEGKPIGGLYAVGNDAASIMGGNYPGPGITLGPGLTFGYIIARHMSGANS
ncbi:FAD-dependent oxidoreductase [Bosea sp. (in: a-proteobacteria)]|uniref:FAD-dependent oxidoreductase n=1 Tax=Bosea sp. (in: a-proteobacteria) TaxID=1871050 RepID=UPI0026078C33|nr:FAD-dependent oxidoreductase [Bosea sp. (in: a-proteobacteria)]MCO5091272.1 FAD-dependent oxidoreductase [Bosea sp. (in: a-proteobacteria)]